MNTSLSFTQSLLISFKEAVASFGGVTSPFNTQWTPLLQHDRSSGTPTIIVFSLTLVLAGAACSVKHHGLGTRTPLEPTTKGAPGSQVMTGSLCVALLEQGEGCVVYVRNLSSDMSSRELKRRFEVFGEIVECQVLTRSKR